MSSPNVIKTSRVEAGGELHRVTDLTHDILKGETFDHTDQLPQHQQDIPRPGIRWSEMGFKMELAGNTAGAGNVPPMGIFFKACGLKETINVGTSVEYSTANDFETDLVPLDIAAHKGNFVKESCLQAIGDMSMILEPGKPAICQFDFTGQYEAPSEAAGVATLDANLARPPICLALTLTFAGVVLIVRKLEWGLGNENNAPRRDLTEATGVKSAVLTGYDPFVKAMIEYPDKATADYVANWTNETKVALNAVLGSAAGNTHTIDGDLYLKSFPVSGDDDGVMSQELEFARSFQSGDTPLKLTVD